MLEAEKWAMNKGFNFVYLKPFNEVVGFYKKCGYCEDDNNLQFMKKVILI